MSISYMLNGKVQKNPLLNSSKNQSHTVSETVSKHYYHIQKDGIRQKAQSYLP